MKTSDGKRWYQKDLVNYTSEFLIDIIMDFIEKEKQIREAVADYMYTEGCSCCQDIDGHAEDNERLAKLLNIPKYEDGSGYDFSKYKKLR